MHREMKWNMSLIKKPGANKMWLKLLDYLWQPTHLKERKKLSSDSRLDVNQLLSWSLKQTPPEMVT